MSERPTPPWLNDVPKDSFVSMSPTYRVGEYFECFREDMYKCADDKNSELKYYYYDPTEHGYPKDRTYPVLIFLHGTSNSFVGITCINYTGAELYASPEYQADFRGAYILVPIANEYREEDRVKGSWGPEYDSALYGLINDFIKKHTKGVGKKFLLGNSSGAAMTLHMGCEYPKFFNALIPVGSSDIPEDLILDMWEELGVNLFLAISKRDEFHDFKTEVEPRLKKLESLTRCFIYTPEWTMNGDKGVASIVGGVEMGQHCLMNSVQANLMFDDGTPMDERLPRGLTGWIDEVNRGALGRGRSYLPHGGCMKTGHVEVEEGVSLFYEEFGSGDRYIISAQAGFYMRGMQQRMAEMGYHVYCVTLRGYHPSTLVSSEEHKGEWYDVFAMDVVRFADKMGIDRFTYMGASHGAGVGWHVMLDAQDRVESFVAVVGGPHSLKQGAMSLRKMLEQGIIKEFPPLNPPIDNDADRQSRRDYRAQWINDCPKLFEEERIFDYGRPLLRLKTEENLCEALKAIKVPVLIIAGYNDPINTPELVMRTAGCLPHCKAVIYSNCGHDIDTDIIEEVSDEADRFLRNVKRTGRCYRPLVNDTN